MNDSDITNAAIQEIAAILATGYLRYRRAQLAGPSPIDPVDCLQRQLQHEQEKRTSVSRNKISHGKRRLSAALPTLTTCPTAINFASSRGRTGQMSPALNSTNGFRRISQSISPSLAAS